MEEPARGVHTEALEQGARRSPGRHTCLVPDRRVGQGRAHGGDQERDADYGRSRRARNQPRTSLPAIVASIMRHGNGG